MCLSKINKRHEIFTFFRFRGYTILQKLIGLVISEEVSVSFIRLFQKPVLKSRTLSQSLICSFACLLTHLFTNTDESVMIN